MQTIRIHTGAMPEAPLFNVYLCALHGKDAIKVKIQAEQLNRDEAIYCDKFDTKIFNASDRAISLALKAMAAPYAAFKAVYMDCPTPRIDSRYGAPMGRVNGNLDHDTYELWRANVVNLDSGGYDKGGAYWGIRSNGLKLYAIQDGSGNVVFIDALNKRDAINKARES